MALPTAVKRNAERAKRQVAAQNAQAANGAPQQSAGEFLDVSALNAPTAPNANIGTVPTDILAARQKQQQQANATFSPPVNDTHRPHALAQGFDGTAQSLVTEGSETASNAAHSANADTAIANGQAISQEQAQPDFIDPDDWKARYAALRASRDARVTSLERQVSESESTIRGLTEKLKKLEGETEAAKRFVLDAETRDRLGPDQAKVFDQFNESIEQRFQRQDDEAKAQAQARRTSFESNLDSLVPRWRTINVEPAFLNWLGEPDEVVGIRRQDMLDQFVNDSDAASVAALFRSFAVSNSRGQQPNGQQHSPELAGNRSSSGMGAEDSMIEMWSQSEIADFYQQKNRLYQSGKLKGAKLQAVEAEEARIRKAMEEGRVDMNA